MKNVEVKFPCSLRCPFVRDCPVGYFIGTCKETIEKAMKKAVTKPIEEIILSGEEITAVTKDHCGKVTVSNGAMVIETKG